jgi:isopenicillin-N epimerase
MKDTQRMSEQDEHRCAPLAEAGRHFLLRRDVTFLNHGSYGACPAPVFETYQRWQRELESEPVEFLGRRIRSLLTAAREPLAAYLGASQHDLVFVPNATHGMNVVARSLQKLLRAGDEVLGTDHEYGAVERTWRFLTEQVGATYRSQQVSLPQRDHDELTGQIWAGVTLRTRILVVSHITSPTALILPVRELIRRARERGIITVVDGAHAPGHIPLALEDLGADFYCGNLHKWLCAPKGSGFLYAPPERQELLDPLIVSWGWRSNYPGVSPFQDYFEWTGTHDPAAYLSVPAAIAFQAEHNWPAVHAACHALVDEAQRRIGELTGLAPISPDGPDWWGQMRTIPLPKRDSVTALALQAQLWDEHQIEIPVHEYGELRLLRLSIQAYNSPANVDRLVSALPAIL